MWLLGGMLSPGCTNDQGVQAERFSGSFLPFVSALFYSSLSSALIVSGLL